MPDKDLKIAIQDAIQQFEKKPLATAATDLLETLGYRSQKRLMFTSNTPGQFMEELDPHKRMNVDKALLSEWSSVDLLFQITDEEIQGAMAGQGQLFVNQKVDNTIINSYLFFAVGLRGEQYSRTQLAAITREINKPYLMPVMVIFKHGQTMTIAIIARRLHKRDPGRDVLEKVTLIKDVTINQPHRAHVEILYDLSVERLAHVHGFTNFVELQRAWEKTLDTSELNKKFFREVANWYFWAVNNVTFPEGAGADEETRNAISVIRLITRLIFAWFIKEKGLVPEDLFDERRLKELLNFSDPNQSTYYKAILQNLFFATLNTEMGENRKFRGENEKGRDQHYMVHNVYRYKRYFQDPVSALNVFAGIPFLNGGLFECLDRPDKDDPKKIGRVDGFSDRDNPLQVPDELFFGAERGIDLNDIYDTKNKKYKVRGLIHIFNSYKFTIEENTPIEEEIALDPELLGKVFENLLAAYNPETGTTARKQTGSFYTPREIVNYMVDESLIAYLERKLEGSEYVQEHLRHLLAYNDEKPQFNDSEIEYLIDAIDNIKVLDPACGSGAFPMGMLHKSVYILSKLDPFNTRWCELQLQKAINETEEAYRIGDHEERRSRLLDIEEVFNNNTSDYGRKLYLIENCIYGVDIQPIAVQIAKLRFFISLVVDQRADSRKPNLGIRPLPNLETKFVAANTLISIEGPKAGKETVISFGDHLISDKRFELQQIRHKHFRDRTLVSKRKHRDQDEQLRLEIAELLKKNGWGSAATAQLAGWDPYDQNTAADFFDPKWMFGIEGGFNVVIGNPPYGLVNKRQNKSEAIVVKSEDFEYYKNSPEYTAAASGMINIFRLFILKSINLLLQGGIFSEIFPLSFVADVSASGLRKYILENCSIYFIEAFPERDDEKRRVFEATKMSVCIMQLTREKNKRVKFFIRIHHDRFVDLHSPKAFFDLEDLSLLDKKNLTIPLMSQEDVDIVAKVYRLSINFSDIGHCYTGEVDLTLGKKYLTDNPQHAILIKGAIIDKFLIRKEMSQGEIKFLDSNRYLSENKGDKSTHYQHRRIVMQGITGVNEKTRLKMTIAQPGVFCGNSANYMIFDDPNENADLYLGVLNSKLYNFIFTKFSTNSNVNGYEVDNLPCPKNVNNKAQKQIVDLVRNILADKRAEPSADTYALEGEIDQLVYGLYGLTDEEIGIVEGNGK